MRPRGSAKALESRRRRALALVEEGLSLNAAARRIGCAASSVLRWWQAFRRRGVTALHVRRASGRPPRLSPRKQARLVKLLLQGPLAHGYRTDLWTTQRIAEVISRRFGVTYHRDHVGRLLHALGWSYQQPPGQTLERAEGATEHWKRTRVSRAKKKLRGWEPITSS